MQLKKINLGDFNRIQTHDLCNAGAGLSPTEPWSHYRETYTCLSHLLGSCSPERSEWMKEIVCEVRFWTEEMILALGRQNIVVHAPEKSLVTSTGFKPMTSVISLQFLSFIHSFYGNTWTQQINQLSIEWLHGSVVKSTASARKGHGFESHRSHLNFFRCIYDKKLLLCKLSIKYEGYFFSSSLKLHFTFNFFH